MRLNLTRVRALPVVSDVEPFTLLILCNAQPERELHDEEGDVRDDRRPEHDRDRAS